MVVAAARVALPALAASSVCFWQGSKLWGCQELSAPPLWKDEITVPASLEEEAEAVGEEMIDETEVLPVEGIFECAFWSEAICLIMLVAELLKRLCSCMSSRRHGDYEEACTQDDDENGQEEDEVLQDAEPERNVCLPAAELDSEPKMQSTDDLEKTRNVCLRAEEPEEHAEAVDAVGRTKYQSLQPEELEQVGVMAVDETTKDSLQPEDADAESNMHLVGVPSPARSFRHTVKSNKCPLRRAEALLAQDPQLACEAADCTIPEDEEWDDRSFHQGRSETVATFVAAYRLLKVEVRGLKEELKELNDAGLALQDEVARLMKENRNLDGDVAYWRELAEGVSSPAKSRSGRNSWPDPAPDRTTAASCQEGVTPEKSSRLDDSEILDEQGTENQDVEQEGSAHHVTEASLGMDEAVGEQQLQRTEDLTKCEKVHLDFEAGEGEQQFEVDTVGEHVKEVHLCVQMEESEEQIREESLPQRMREACPGCGTSNAADAMFCCKSARKRCREGTVAAATASAAALAAAAAEQADQDDEGAKLHHFDFDLYAKKEHAQEEKAAAEQEARRKTAEDESKILAAEQDAKRLDAEEVAKRLDAEEEAKRLAAEAAWLQKRRGGKLQKRRPDKKRQLRKKPEDRQQKWRPRDLLQKQRQSDSMQKRRQRDLLQKQQRDLLQKRRPKQWLQKEKGGKLQKRRPDKKRQLRKRPENRRQKRTQADLLQKRKRQRQQKKLPEEKQQKLRQRDSLQKRRQRDLLQKRRKERQQKKMRLEEKQQKRMTQMPSRITSISTCTRRTNPRLVSTSYMSCEWREHCS
eukprot:TRINITY_DN1721_c0_g1_i16.p1 TRINITY_DN1721_c0_g1~~TRINITY_DN1721_c0_g1_i16.p1  ORF type:complete len:825 (-),score=282.56 TRINITY_DN1721_c0_g1_i16:376-2796(-)